MSWNYLATVKCLGGLTARLRKILTDGEFAFRRGLPYVAILFPALLVGTSTFAQNLSGAFEFKRPAELGVTLFASGYAFEKGASTYEGFELEQTLTPYLSIVGAVSGYQFWKGTGGYDSPLTPAAKGAPRNFGRFQGGVDVIPFQGTSLIVLGGEDAGDSHAPVIQGIFSTWVGIHSSHPLNVAFDAWHYYQNGVSSGTYDIRTIALSTADFLLLAGIGGAIWGGGGGTLSSAKTHGGLDLGVFIRNWHLELDVQGGYGTSHTYGIVMATRHFSWEE